MMADLVATQSDGGKTMGSLMQSLRDLGPVKLAAMALVSLLLIGFFTFLSMRMSSPVMAPLYNNLPMEDGAQVMAELDSKGIPYEVRANGAQILVPSDEVGKVRMSMAGQGIPSNGSIVGNEIFDKDDTMGTSNFVLNVNLIRALEGELSRTISAFTNIDSATVKLVVPKKELFTREKQEATASVFINPRGANDLSKEQIRAIQHLVATAVPGLKSNKITIVDKNGKLLARGLATGEEDDAFATDAQEYRANQERKMQTRIEDLLTSSLGAGKAKAEISADIDFDRIVTNSETYDPESQVARSVQESEETEDSKDKEQADNVSVGNNLPDTQPTAADGNQSSRVTSRTDATTNYEISKEVKNHVRETGTIKKLSAAILVDGTYTTNDDGDRVYTPRTEAEITQIATLVKSAIGFDAERGDTVEVVNMQFPDNMVAEAEAGPMDWLQDDLQGIIQTLVVFATAIVALLIIVRPLVNRAIEASRQRPELDEVEQAALLGGPAFATAQLTDQRGGGLAPVGGFGGGEEDLISIDRVQGRVKSASYRKITDMVENHPDESLNIIRQWMLNAS